jgi:decaprenylphospho-beta-D-ribofuranose 2-oxidase
VHGKNHHADGGFCQWVARFTLATPTGIFEVDPSSQPEVFWATAGGMGLTGVVTQATLRLLPISTASMAIRTDRTPDLDGALELLSADDGHYSVAWIDLLARGAGTGRAVVTRGRHAHPDELPAGRDPAGREPAGRDRTGGHRLAYAPSRRLSAPPWVPGGLLNTTTVRAFNEIWYRKAPRAQHGLQSLQGFFHPLDGIGGWNRVYGRHGFVQYQFVVPISGLEVLRGAVELFAHDRVPGFLAVLKRLGPQPGLLSFPLAGWTLALDIPRATPGLAGLLDRLDEQVAEAGGRVYLTKDARLRPDVLAVMYPALERWRAIQAELDPGGVLRSDLSRRLGLLPPPPKAADGH